MSQLTPPPNQTIPKEESRRKRKEEVRGSKGKYEEVLAEGRGPRVPRSKGSKVQGSNLNVCVTFKMTIHVVRENSGVC